MRYPAELTWCDEEPGPEQDRTTRQLIRDPEELETALDRFERDTRRLKLPLLAELFDREGHCLTFGFSPAKELSFLTFQPVHTLRNERGHFQHAPLRWSVSPLADAANLPPINQVHGPDRVGFLFWPGYDPLYVMPAYCVPFSLVRRALGEYLDRGEFSTCLGWGARPDPTTRP